MSADRSSFEVIYLTGPPASGKSTLGRLLAKRIPTLQVFHYSKLLADHLARSSSGSGSDPVNEDHLRQHSSQIITPEDVAAVDDALITAVTDLRRTRPILIDSHPVTKESYGYRVTPFPMPKLRALAPSKVCMIYAEAAEIIHRIGAESGGRPMVNSFQADLHTFLQAQVVSAYALDLGLPLYLLDSTASVEAAAERIAGWIQPQSATNV